MADTKQTEATTAANNNEMKKPLKKKIIKRPAAAKKAAATAKSTKAEPAKAEEAKAPAKKAVAKKAAAKKSTAKKSTKKKSVTKKSTAKTAPAVKKAPVKKTVAKKTPAKTAKRKAPKKSAAIKRAVKAAPKPATKAAASNTIFNVQPQILEIVKMTKTPFQFDQLAQEATEAGREGFEAFVKSGTIFAKGFEDLMKTAANLSQSAAEKQAEFAKQLMASKTLNEFAETQNKIAQANFDQFMAGATKLSEMSVKVLSEGSEPINAQVNKTMQKANKAMAA